MTSKPGIVARPHVSFAQQEFVAVNDVGQTNQVLATPDGLAWSQYADIGSNFWTDTCYSPTLGIFVAVAADGGSSPFVMTSPNGVQWTGQSAPSGNWVAVCWSPDLELFAAVANTGDVMTSPDGAAWTLQSVPVNLDLTDICWARGVGLFVAVCFSGSNQVLTSPDGANWTQRVTPSSDLGLFGVVWAQALGMIVAVGTGDGSTYAITSTDGLAWTARAAQPAGWSSIAWSDELALLVAVANDASPAHQVMTSSNGTAWTFRTSAAPGAKIWQGVAWSSPLGLFAAVSFDGNSNQAMTSPDGSAWTLRATPAGPDIRWHGLSARRVERNTWDPADKSTDLTLSNGNLTVSRSISGALSGVRGGVHKRTGVHSVIHTINPLGGTWLLGVARATWSLPSVVGFYGIDNGGNIYNSNNVAIGHYNLGLVAGDTLEVVVDFGAGTVRFKKNGVQLVPNSGVEIGGLAVSVYPAAAIGTTNPVFTSSFASW